MSETDNLQPAGDPVARYLLGDSLPGDREAEIEERYFGDDSYLDFVLSVEDALIDEYVRGALTREQRALFQSHFLASGRRREKWEAQRAIASFFRSSDSAPEPLSWLRRILKVKTGRFWVVGFMALLAMATFLGWTDFRLNKEVSDARARPSSTVSQIPIPAIAVLNISPGRLRSGSADDVFRIQANSDWIDLRARLYSADALHASYTATLTTPENEEIWKEGRLTSTGTFLDARLSASLLVPGDYILILTGIDGGRKSPLPSYQFRIER